MSRPLPRETTAAIERDLRAGELRQADIVRKYGVARKTIRSIAIKAGLFTPGLVNARPAPPEFAALAATMSNTALSRRFKTSWQRCADWRLQLGLDSGPTYDAVATGNASAAKRWAGHTRKKQTPRKHGRGFPAAAPAATFRDLSLAGRAADECLRRYGPVYRCNERGGADTKGAHWRFGRVVLTPEELVERARAKGWDSDAWRSTR